MNGNVVFGQYFYSDSWLHRLDPRTKIISVLLYMIAVFLISSLYVLLGFFTFTIIILITSKIPLSKFLRSIRMLSYLLFLTFIFQVLFRKTGTVLETFEFNLTVVSLVCAVFLLVFFSLSRKFIKKHRFILFLLTFVFGMYLQTVITFSYSITKYQVVIYSDSLLDALFLITRIITIILTSSLLTLTTKPTELNNGLEKLLKPLDLIHKNASSILSMMTSIALRNIPTLINEANKILKAQSSRGVDFKEATLKERMNQIISLIVPMFIIAYKKADDLSEAMEARGFNPYGKRTTIHILKFKLSDILVLVFLSLVLFGSIYFKIVGLL